VALRFLERIRVFDNDDLQPKRGQHVPTNSAKASDRSWAQQFADVPIGQPRNLISDFKRNFKLGTAPAQGFHELPIFADDGKAARFGQMVAPANHQEPPIYHPTLCSAIRNAVPTWLLW